MRQKIKLSLVSYNNTLPFQYVFQHADFSPYSAHLSKDYPSLCASKLIKAEADVGIVPVAAMISQPHLRRVTDFCIGAVGKVKTVALLSDVPISQLQNIRLDYQSRTSNLLAKLLCHFYWKKPVTFLDGYHGFETSKEENTGKIVIGDRVFELSAEYEYVYDLAEEWNKFTGLPFVFAAWYADVSVKDDFIKLFNRQMHHWFDRYWDSSEFLSLDGYMKNYLLQNISFSFDCEKRKGLDLFLKMASGVT